MAEEAVVIEEKVEVKTDAPVEVLDPGQEEGNKVKTYVDTNHPPEGSKRWNEIYYKSKEYDRQKETIDSAKKTEEAFALMRKQNKDLTEALTRSAVATEAQTASTVVDPKIAELGKIDEQLVILKEDKEVALKAGNAKAVVEIDEQILQSTTDRAMKEAEIKATPEPLNEDQKIVQRIALATEWLNPKGEKYDVIMESAAIALDNSLRATIPNTEERLTKVTKEIERRFSYKVEGTEEEETTTTTKPTASNISGAFSAQPASIKVQGNGADKEIVLTPAQEHAAKKMFPEEADPIATYKNQLRLMAQ